MTTSKETVSSIIDKALGNAKFMDPVTPEIRKEWERIEKEVEADVFGSLDKMFEKTKDYNPEYIEEINEDVERATTNIQGNEISLRVEAGQLIFGRDHKEPEYKALSYFLDHCQTELGYTGTVSHLVRMAVAKAITKWIQRINPHIIVESIADTAERRKWWDRILLEIYVKKEV